jgi:hypothetical protein
MYSGGPNYGCLLALATCAVLWGYIYLAVKAIWIFLAGGA